MIQVIPRVVNHFGRTKIRLTISDGGKVLDGDLIDPFDADKRRRAVTRLAKRVGDPQLFDQIEETLLQVMAALQLPEPMVRPGEEGDLASAMEDDVTVDATPYRPMTVVRPEMIVMKGLVALSFPEVVVKGGQAVGRWRVFIRTADGRCATRPLAPRLELPKMGTGVISGAENGVDNQSNVATGSAAKKVPVPISSDAEEDSAGEVLWVHPMPAAPSPSTPRLWSATAQRAWMEGAVVEPRGVFDRLCAAFDRFLDVGQESGEGTRDKTERDKGQDAKGEAPGLVPCPSSLVPATPHPTIATLALWTMLSYVYVGWDAVPYLFLTGPAGSGKTRVFELLMRLVYRPLASSNLSAPALFRTLHDRGGTLLLDEAERLSEGGDDIAELRSILLAGYRRGGRASRLESAGGGGDFKMCEFSVFGPKAIACINSLPTALASRCIQISMFRSPPHSDKPRLRIDADPRYWRDLRDDLHALALGPLGLAVGEWLSEDALACPMSGRQYELWQPLLAMARWLDGLARDTIDTTNTAPFLHPRLLAYAKGACDVASDSLLPEADFMLLWTLAEKATREQEVTPMQLLEAAKRLDPESLKGMSARRVSDTLRRYGLKIVRSQGKNIYRDVLPQLKAIENRYGVDLNTAGIRRINVQTAMY